MDSKQKATVHTEDYPIGDSNIKHDARLQLGFEETHKEARNPWKVLLENKKLLLLILAVQSNAVIVGVEFSMPGNLLGIPAFLKEV